MRALSPSEGSGVGDPQSTMTLAEWHEHEAAGHTWSDLSEHCVGARRLPLPEGRTQAVRHRVWRAAFPPEEGEAFRLCHLVLEETQVFAPQRAQGEERMLGAMEDLVRLGRA